MKAALEEAVEESRKIAEERRKIVDALVAGNDFVWIPPGEFRMGSKSSEAGDDERPRTRVRDQPGVLPGQVRGDAGGVAGGDGQQSVPL